MGGLWGQLGVTEQVKVGQVGMGAADKVKAYLISITTILGLTNLWVISTDYSSYAILYSCTIDVTVTECPTDHAQLLVLSKK